LFREKVALLKKLNTAPVISLVSPQAVTEADEKGIRTNIPEARRVYKDNAKALIFGTPSLSRNARTTLLQQRGLLHRRRVWQQGVFTLRQHGNCGECMPAKGSEE
jgi:hypothetical protein